MSYASEAAIYLVQIASFDVLMYLVISVTYDPPGGLQWYSYPLVLLTVYGNAWILFRRIDSLVAERVDWAMSRQG